MKFTDKIRRIYRRLFGNCVVCGWNADGCWYCGIECACYDGTFTCQARNNITPNINGWRRKPELFRGYTEKRMKKENYN